MAYCFLILQNDLLCQTFSTSEQYHLFGLRDTMNTFENYTIATLPKGVYICLE